MQLSFVLTIGVNLLCSCNVRSHKRVAAARGEIFDEWLVAVRSRGSATDGSNESNKCHFFLRCRDGISSMESEKDLVKTVVKDRDRTIQISLCFVPE